MHNEKDKTYRLSFEKLMEEIKKAKVVDSIKMPSDVIRLNSVVTIKTDFGGEKKFQLVIPSKSDLSQNKLSVMAPMGLALFGYAENDEVEWEFPSGLNTIKIIKVEQPL
ncbi:MAG: transcription elongation factor GreAB [Bacteroidetes bacterium HGW-Bacteroidetes-23]|nr:MAG: transcription elongation factor GreAB [Bacteroidetes bacterium HGW-Bacteroidetes-23]